MKYTNILLPLLTITATTTAYHLQKPIMAPHVSKPTQVPAPDNEVLLADILGRDKTINIFSGLTRDIASIDARLSDASKKTTLLAPVNSAIMALPRKAWENPAEYDSLGADAYEGDVGQARARENLKKFVEAHVVGMSPWEEGVRAKTIGGDEVWWEMKAGRKVVMPRGIEIKGEEKVGNGEVWVTSAVINYA